MEKTDVLVIGGSAAGIVAATTGKANYPDKDFLLIRKEKQVLVPCGIPYIFGSLESSDKNVIPDGVLSKACVNLKIGEAVSIDQKKKSAKQTTTLKSALKNLCWQPALSRQRQNG